MIWRVLRQIGKAGCHSEPAPDIGAAAADETSRIQSELLQILGQALCIRQIDAGSCNGCELEINALGNPYYNLEGLGIKFVASPRHADLLLVTGPVSRNMETALKRSFDATPEPKLVLVVGDCGWLNGVDIVVDGGMTAGRLGGWIDFNQSPAALVRAAARRG